MESTYIPAWESIVITPASSPGAPDTSVQFNDGGAFGGSAFFTFDKVMGHAALGNNSQFDRIKGPASGATVFGGIIQVLQENLSGPLSTVGNGDYAGLVVVGTYDETGAGFGRVYGVKIQPEILLPSVGVFAELTGVEIRLRNIGSGAVTDCYGLHIFNNADAFGTIVNNYGLYLGDQSNAGSALSFNLFSDGANSGNAFLGNSGFGVVPEFGGLGSGTPSTTLLAADTTSGNEFNFRSKGATGRNFIEGKWEVVGHSHFGDLNSAYGDNTSISQTVFIGQLFAGNLNAGTYSALGIGNTYDPSAGAPSIFEINVSPTANTGSFTNVEGIFSQAQINNGADAQSLFGVVGLAQSAAGAIITEYAIGVSGEIQMAGDVTGANFVAGVQALVNSTVVPAAYGFYMQSVSGGTLNYGLFVSEVTAAGYNIWSDHTLAVVGQGKNFLGAGAQIGATDLNISRIAAGQLGIGTGAEGSVAGTLRAIAIGIAGAIAAGEELTVTGQASISGSLAIGGAIAGGEELTVTGQASITDTLLVTGILTNTGGIIVGTATALVTSNVAMNDGTAAQIGTLTNAPTAGNPSKWVPIIDNGTTRFFPTWQ